MAWINSTRIPQLGDRHDSAGESGTYATYSARFLILLWQMDSHRPFHRRLPEVGNIHETVLFNVSYPLPPQTFCRSRPKLARFCSTVERGPFMRFCAPK